MISEQERVLRKYAPSGKVSVTFCYVCRTKTWHKNGVCEWSDSHERMEDARAERECAEARLDHRQTSLLSGDNE